MIKINAYKCTPGKIHWKEPLEIEVTSNGDMFCVLKIEDREVLVKGAEVITAMQAACDVQ